MIELDGSEIDDFGDVIFNDDGIIDLLLNKTFIKNPIISNIENQDKFNIVSNFLVEKYQPKTCDVDEYHHKRSNEILIPDAFKDIDIRSYVLSLNNTDEEIKRINEECDIIEKRNMENFFRCMIYIVFKLRENGIVWGVGRGSCVASLVLYKIGIHKINPLKYDIDYNEFFKE